MPDKIHCGNCGISNKPSCYSTCLIKLRNESENKLRQQACKVNPVEYAIAQGFQHWCKTHYYKKGRV